MRARAMAIEDAAAVADLSGQLGYPSTRDQIARRFRALEPMRDSAIIVAETDEGKLAGWAHVIGRTLLESDPFAELMGLVVDTALRRRGVGRILVTAAERWATEHGYTSLHVRSNMLRAEARSFYERLGYSIVKTQNVFVKALE